MHVSENKVIVNKIVFHLAINIPRNIDNFLKFCCVSKWQCINAPYSIMQLCHYASFYIIDINPMVHTYVLCKERWGKLQNDYMHKKHFIDEHLNVCIL